MDFLLVICRRWLLCLLCVGLAITVNAQQYTLDDIYFALHYQPGGSSVGTPHAVMMERIRSEIHDGFLENNNLLWTLHYHYLQNSSLLTNVLDNISSSFHYNYGGHDLTPGEMLYLIWHDTDASLGDIMSGLEMFRYQYLQAQNRIEDHESVVEMSLGDIAGQLSDILRTLGMDAASYFGSIAGNLGQMAQHDYWMMHDGDVLMYGSGVPPDDIPMGLDGELPDEDVGPGSPDEPDVDEIANTYLDGEEALAESAEKAAQTEEAFAEVVEDAFENIANESSSFNSVFVIDYDLPSIPRLGKPIKLHLSLDFAGKDFKVFRDASAGLFSAFWLALYIFAVWMFVRHEINGMIAN